MVMEPLKMCVLARKGMATEGDQSGDKTADDSEAI